MERAITCKNTAQVLQSSGLSVAERLSTFGLPYEIEKLIQLERSIPVSIGLDETARLKITDSCGMACVFCHNEGTPVAAAYHGDISSPNFSYMGGESQCLNTAMALISYLARCCRTRNSTTLGFVA